MTLPRVLLCTTNRHKVEELTAMLSGLAQVVTPAQLGLNLTVHETEDTFEGNARLKALAGWHASGLITVADDSGLCVAALDGAPGVRSARFALDHGAGEGDQANNALLLKRLAGVPDAERGAFFVSAVAVAAPGGTRTFRGEVHGRVGTEARGAGGFGYDPLFVLPDGRAMAELPAEEKNALSHRGAAMEKARPHLTELVRVP